MSTLGAVNLKSWGQELKSNRRTQVALGVLVVALVWLFWPEAPRRKAPAARGVITTPDDRPLESLQKLRDLTQLDRAGELPNEGRMYRDLFLFDMPPGPPPPPPKPVPPPPPPPPPTPEELAAQQLAQARQAATNSRPQDLRYLGYLGRPSSPRIGAFARGDEVISVRQGDIAAPGWRLVTLTENYAEFANLKFPDIRFRAEAKDSAASANPNTTNQF